MARMHDDDHFSNARKPIAAFDFDVWAELARNDPDEFERQRRKAIDSLLQNMDGQDERLKHVSMRIEQQRASQPAHEVLAWMMSELGRSFSQLNEDFLSQVKRWPD